MTAAVLPVAFVLDMGEGDVDNIYDMLVIQRIKYVFSVAAALYQPFVLEEAKLVGDRRFCHIKGGCYIVYAQFICGNSTEYFHSGFVAYNLKEGCGLGYKFLGLVFHGFTPSDCCRAIFR